MTASGCRPRSTFRCSPTPGSTSGGCGSCRARSTSINTAPSGAELTVPDRRGFAFLSAFDFQERKGWRPLLEAYAREFDAEDDVTLVLKVETIFADVATVQARIDAFLNELGLPAARRPHIVLLHQRLSDAEMPALFRACDAYVSPTRGEGWGRPLMEALACGLPVITSRWSAPLAFLDDTNAWFVDGGLIPVPDDVDIPVFRGGRWFDPDVDALRAAMRAVTTTRRRRARPRWRRGNACAPASAGERSLNEPPSSSWKRCRRRGRLDPSAERPAGLAGAVAGRAGGSRRRPGHARRSGRVLPRRGGVPAAGRRCRPGRLRPRHGGVTTREGALALRATLLPWAQRGATLLAPTPPAAQLVRDLLGLGAARTGVLPLPAPALPALAPASPPGPDTVLVVPPVDPAFVFGAVRAVRLAGHRAPGDRLRSRRRGLDAPGRHRRTARADARPRRHPRAGLARRRRRRRP